MANDENGGGSSDANQDGSASPSQGGFQKPMYDVDEVCAQCGTQITKLPFPPNPARKNELKCVDCYRQSRPARRQW